MSFCINVKNTVKSQFVAAATNFFGDLSLRPLFEGGYYLRAAIIAKIPKNYVKLHEKRENFGYFT